MSSITIRLPDSLHKKIREVSRKEGISINQFISSAAGEKLASVLTVEYLEARAKKGKNVAFDRILDKVPDVEPLEGDER